MRETFTALCVVRCAYDAFLTRHIRVCWGLLCSDKFHLFVCVYLCAEFGIAQVNSGKHGVTALWRQADAAGRENAPSPLSPGLQSEPAAAPRSPPQCFPHPTTSAQNTITLVLLHSTPSTSFYIHFLQGEFKFNSVTLVTSAGK